MFRKNGATSAKTRVALVSSTTGLASTGLTTVSAGLIISAIADTEASGTAYSGANIETITTIGTYAAPTSGKVRFKEVDATNHPGLYEIQLADARWAVSNALALQVTVIATGVLTTHKEVQLTAVDPALASFGLSLAKTTNITGFNDIAAPTGFAAATFPSGTIANTTNMTAGTIASVTNDVGITQAGADKVWGSATRTLSSFGSLVADIATAVWAATTRVLTAGTNIVLAKGTGITGFNDLSAAQVNAEADTAISDAALATAANLATVAGYLDTEIAAILADTNELQTDWTNGGRLDLILDARASQTSVDDVPTNTELATALGTADDATLSAIAALNNLSAAQVGVVVAASSVASVTGNVDGNVNGTIGEISLTASSQIADSVWNDALASHVVAGSFGAAVGAVKTVTDKLDTAVVVDGAVYQFTANALELAPTGGSAPTAAQIAEAMFTFDATADYSTANAGSVVKQIADNAGGSSLTATDIANEVQTRTIAGVTTVGTVTNDVGITQAAADKVWGSASRTLTSFGSLVADVATAVWSAVARTLTAGTNIVLAKGVGLTGLNDLTAAQVNAEADTALSDVGLTTTITGRIDAAVSSRLAGASYTTPDNAGIATAAAASASAAIDASTLIGRLTAGRAANLDYLDALISGRAAAGDVPSAAAIEAAIWTRIIEGGFTAEELMRGYAAAMLGKASGLATNTANYRDVADTKNRISAAVDEFGNRTAVTLDLS